MQLSDRLIGLIAIFSGAAVFVGTLDFREIPGQQFGSAFFPQILAIAFVTIGLILVLRRTQKMPFQWPVILRGKSGLQVALVLISVLIWVWLAPLLGFMLTTALIVFTQIVVAGGRVLIASLSASVVSLLLYLIFAVALRVPLPIGIIERLIQ